MKKILFFLLLMTINIVSFTLELEGTGYGKTPGIARQLALEDLSTNIKQSTDANVDLVSGDDFMGIEYKSKKYFLRKKYRVIAIITSDKLGIYENQVESLKHKIDSNVKLSESADSLQEKKEMLETTLDNMALFNSYKGIAEALGSEKTVTLNHTKADINSRLKRIEDILNAPKVMYVTLTGDYPKEAHDYLKNNVDNLISTLSENSSTKLVITNTMSDEVTTLFNINVNSNYVNLTDAVTYNGKNIVGEKYEASINITITAKDTKLDEYLINKTVDANAYDFNSDKSALYKAITSLFRQEEEVLKDSFSF